METIKGFRFLREINEQDKRDAEIAYGMLNHLYDARQHFSDDQIVFLGLQGSQNYNLDTATSDIDTKLIVVPGLNDLIFNHKAVSITFIRENNEHTDWKDLRLMFQTFRKQNLNFVEIIYSPWILVNETYYEEIKDLFEHRDLIGFYDKPKAVQTMKGIALNKYDAMEKNTPAHAKEMEKFGYSPKELHHLIRVTEFLKNYIEGYPYEYCLYPSHSTWLKDVKMGAYSIEEARNIADKTKATLLEICDSYLSENISTPNPEGDLMLDGIQRSVMRKAIELELTKK